MSDCIKYGRKRSNIKREIEKKLKAWFSSIQDENVRKIAMENTIVTGGCIASMLLGEKVNDFDIYFRTLEAAQAIAEYYVEKFNKRVKIKKGDVESSSCTPAVENKTITNIKGEREQRVIIYMKSSGVAAVNMDVYQYFEQRDESETDNFMESLSVNASQEKTKDFAEKIVEGDGKEKDKYSPIFLSQNAITLSGKIQLIIRFFGEAEKIHSYFDFVHPTSYFESWSGDLVLKPEAMEALLCRTLYYNGSLYPIASIFRAKKFMGRGWRISAGQLMKIMWQISELNLKDVETCMDQLTGVDQAYMFQLRAAIKEAKGKGDEVDSTYVAKLIDAIFD